MTNTTPTVSALLPRYVRDRLIAAAKSFPDDPDRRNQEIDNAKAYAKLYYPEYFKKES